MLLRDDAVEEFSRAKDWYERQRPGLGSALAAELERVILQLATMPETFPVVNATVRRALFTRFPYVTSCW